MPAGVEIFNSVLNQLGSPAIYSDVFANRPAFGYTGRLFISTDTNEIYRDTGTAWVLISSGGGGVNIYNSNGTLTAARTMTMAGFPLTFSGGASAVNLNLNANAGVDRDINFQTAGVNRWEFLVTGAETGSNAGADFALRSYNDAGTFIFSPFTVRRRTGEIETFAEENITTGGQSIIGLYTNSTGTYAGGLTTTGGNPQSSNFNIYTLATAGNVTFANSNLVGTTVNVLRAQVQNAGTVTFPASATSALRAATNFVSQLQYNTSAAAGTFTHMANIHLQGIYEVSGGNVFTITNAYQLLINSLNENGYTGAQLALANRWGIYQDGASDLNYFAANTLLGTTTNTGERLQVAGTARVTQSAYLATASGDVGIGTTTPQTAGAGFKNLDIRGSSGGSLILGSTATLVSYLYSTTSATVLETTGTTPISFSLGGATRVRITSTGDVGIGTTLPTFGAGTGLEIERDSATATLRLQRATGNPSNLELRAAADIGELIVTSNTPLVIGTSNTERARITTGGNVLIGTTIDNGNKLQVVGNGALFGDGTNTFSIYFNTARAWEFKATGTGAGTQLRLSDTTGGKDFIIEDATSTNVSARFTNGTVVVSESNTGNFRIGSQSAGTSANLVYVQRTGTAPSTSPADCFQLYSADVTAGNAAAHFRTENGAIVKVYQETTAVGSATVASPGAGSTVKTDDTFDGYTLQQVVKALRNQGLLA